MNKALLSILSVMLLSVTLISCDNRSQLQKDMDSAVSETEKAAATAEKKLGF